jgi:hypothetical protein
MVSTAFPAIDTDAHRTKSGGHGWVYGYQLPLIVTVGVVFLPPAAKLAPATVADNEEAALLLDAPRAAALFVLGDRRHDDADLLQRRLHLGAHPGRAIRGLPAPR